MQLNISYPLDFTLPPSSRGFLSNQDHLTTLQRQLLLTCRCIWGNHSSNFRLLRTSLAFGLKIEGKNNFVELYPYDEIILVYHAV